MVRKYLHRGLIITFSVITLVAVWGALRLPPLGAKSLSWGESGQGLMLIVGVQDGASCLYLSTRSHLKGMPAFLYKGELLGSAVITENKQYWVEVCPPSGNDSFKPSPGPFRMQAMVRLWQIAIVSAIYPMLSFLIAWRRKRNRNVNPMACATCRYDLTGNESGACPECGQSIPLPERHANTLQ